MMVNSNLTNEEIRKLYWDSKNTVDYIMKVTGFKLRDLIVISGPVEVCCEACGSNFEVRTRTERSNCYTLWKPLWVMCPTCRDLSVSFGKLFGSCSRLCGGVSWDDDGYTEAVRDACDFIKLVGLEKAVEHYDALVSELHSTAALIKERIFVLRNGDVRRL